MLFKHVEPAINLIIRGETQIFEANELGGGQLRIGASDTICRYFLVPYLNEFHKKYPKVHIKVTNGTSLQCVELLESNQVDIIIINTPNSRLNNITSIRTIKNFQDVFIVNKEAFHIEDTTFSLEDLLNYPILMLEKNSTTSEYLHNLFLSHSLDLVPAIELSSNDLLIDLAKIGLGIAFIPDFCIKGDMEGLITLKTCEELPKRTLVAAYTDQIPLSGAAQYFLDSLDRSDAVEKDTIGE